MKFISSVALALTLALSHKVTATPVQSSSTVEARGQVIGGVTFCNLSDQCYDTAVPYDRSIVCMSFDGDLAFLNDQLKKLTFTSAFCVAYEDFGCAGTKIGGDVALPSTRTVDYTNFMGSDVSGRISSVQCGFL